MSSFLLFHNTYSAASSATSSTASLRTSEAVTTIANSHLTLEVNLINIVYSPTLLIGAFKETFFLSISIPDFANNSSVNFLVVIVPNNLPDSPAFAESSSLANSSIFLAVSRA